MWEVFKIQHLVGQGHQIYHTWVQPFKECRKMHCLNSVVRTSKQAKHTSCRMNSWFYLSPVIAQQTKIQLIFQTQKRIQQNSLTWQQFRDLLLPTHKRPGVWAPISSKRYCIGIHSWHPSFPWHCMAIVGKKWRGEWIGCFHKCHLTAQLLPSPLIPSSLQCIRGDEHKHDVVTSKGARHTTNKAYTLWAGASTNTQDSIANPSK